MSEIKITIDDLDALKAQYEKSFAAGEDKFNFKGGILMTAYAKYLVQHLENQKKLRDGRKTQK